MFTLEEHQKAVDLFTESNRKENIVIQQLGYPSPSCLRKWYKKFMEIGLLYEKSKPKPRFTEEEIAYAIEYYHAHELTYTQTCRELGYPTRNILKKWIANSSIKVTPIDYTPPSKMLRYST